MKPRARPPSTLLSSPSNPSFVPNSNAHYQLLLSLSLTSSTNYLSSCICARKQSAMPVKFRTKPRPPEKCTHFFPLTIQPGEGEEVSRPRQTCFQHVRYQIWWGHAVVLHRYTGRYRGAIVPLFRYTHYEALTGPGHYHPRGYNTLLLRQIPQFFLLPSRSPPRSSRHESLR